MPFETRFTHEEQVLLASLPNLIGSAMTFAEGSGLGTVKEMIATSKSFLAGRELATNEIVSGILPNMQNMDALMQDSKEMRGMIQEHLQSHEVKSKEQLRQLAVEDAGKVNVLLQAKAEPQEAEQYKNWVLDIAEDVSKAAKEGGFLGFGGTQVSEKEKTLFTELAGAMGVSRSMH